MVAVANDSDELAKLEANRDAKVRRESTRPPSKRLAARLLPGTPVPIEVIDELPIPGGQFPAIGDLI